MGREAVTERAGRESPGQRPTGSWNGRDTDTVVSFLPSVEAKVSTVGDPAGEREGREGWEQPVVVDTVDTEGVEVVEASFNFRPGGRNRHGEEGHARKPEQNTERVTPTPAGSIEPRRRRRTGRTMEPNTEYRRAGDGRGKRSWNTGDASGERHDATQIQTRGSAGGTVACSDCFRSSWRKRWTPWTRRVRRTWRKGDRPGAPASFDTSSNTLGSREGATRHVSVWEGSSGRTRERAGENQPRRERARRTAQERRLLRPDNLHHPEDLRRTEK